MPPGSHARPTPPLRPRGLGAAALLPVPPEPARRCGQARSRQPRDRSGYPPAALDIRTHHAIDRELCGTPDAVAEGTATVSLATTLRMAVDDHGLVHGGFVFGLADHAAMLAVNEPTVVLGAAELRLLAPVRAGQRVVATATVVDPPGKKILVDVEARADEVVVLTGRLTCFVPPRHVLAPAAETKETTP
jgi:acyl-coenzyme A thioesterase PaaI-like protein